MLLTLLPLLVLPLTHALPTTSTSTSYLNDRVGGIDMNRACIEQYGIPYQATPYGHDCSAWRCVWHGIGTMYSVDTERACIDQYGPGLYSYCDAGAYGWGCFKK